MSAKSAAVSTSSSSVSSDDALPVGVELGPAGDAVQVDGRRARTAGPAGRPSPTACTWPVSVVIVSSHWSSGTRGVGPADSTGKSSVRYCPGGRSGAERRRPENPRDTTIRPTTLLATRPTLQIVVGLRSPVQSRPAGRLGREDAGARPRPDRRSEQELELELVRDRHAALVPQRDRRLDPARRIDTVPVEGAEVQAETLVEVDRTHIVVGGRQPEPAATPAAGVGDAASQQRATYPLPSTVVDSDTTS